MFPAINWNQIENSLDKVVWDRLTSNFWLPEKVPVANDKPSWDRMQDTLKEVVKKAFVSLTAFDTLQGEVGGPTLMKYANTQHSRAVFANITFMEEVHAKSYSTIFSTLCSSQEIQDLFEWANTDKHLQQQIATIRNFYTHYNRDPYMVMVASVFLESMLFYTGFYPSLRLASAGILTNTADIIRLIIRDEGVHGYYIGQLSQQIKPENVHKDVIELMETLVEVEQRRIQDIYTKARWDIEVTNFLKYNANKALSNLGFESYYESNECKVSPAILASLDPGGTETHDFFSGSGSSYVIGNVEDLTEEDWEV